MNHAETKEFTMDPNLLVSVIKSQAGTLTKALLEGVMNSIDAGATRVDLSLSEYSYSIQDNGVGFKSGKEIEDWFGRFGTPHKEGDATFGRYRMGRGQLFAFSRTRWSSNQFRMSVDLEKSGLTYDLEVHPELVKGCRVEGELYTPLETYRLNDTLVELRKFIAYAPKPVYVNGELFGTPAAKIKNWTHEDEHAFYRILGDAESLLVYNQGVFVCSVDTWYTGVGGIIVSKGPLTVNFARNAILENQCVLWPTLRERLQTIGAKALSTFKGLNDGQRKYLARQLLKEGSKCSEVLLNSKVLTTPTGQHLPMKALKSFDKFLYIPDNTALACGYHGQSKTFVITDQLLARFGHYSPENLLDAWRGLPGVLAENFELLDISAASKKGLGGSKLLEPGDDSRKMKVRWDTLKWLHSALVPRLVECGAASRTRELRMGTHKQKNFIAWTDGGSYVTANRAFLKVLDSGLDGMLFWLQTLIHEYMHDTDDSESHAHGEVFYAKYHDVSSAPQLKLASLAQAGVVRYLQLQAEHGLSQSNALKKLLRPSFREIDLVPGQEDF